MYLSARSRIILERILSVKDDSVKKLAHHLDVSERTVRRDLDEVKQTLAQFNLMLIKKGSKLSVNGVKKDRDRIREILLHFVSNEYTPPERQQIILRELLTTNGPMKLIALASKLSVTVATVSSDLTRIEEEWNEKVNIVRKRGIGVQLKAAILEKRELLRELTLISYPKRKLYQHLKDILSGTKTPVKEELSMFINLTLLDKADRNLTKWMKKLPYEIGNTSYLNLLLYLLITIQQIGKGQKIHKYPDSPIFLQDYPEHDIAERILKDCLPEETIPEAEITELTMQILDSEIHKGQDLFYHNEKVQALRIAKKLISKVTKEMDMPLAQMTILKGLTEHIRSSLIRLKKKMPLTNPLLPLIKVEFGELFSLIHKEAAALYPFHQLPEEETGFIVLHFEAAILRSENMYPYSALIVTSGSNGVNTWLEARFRKKLPKLKKIKFITSLELVKEKALQAYDIILSTDALENFPFEYQQISLFISNNEILQIQQYLEKMANTKNKLYYKTDMEKAETLSNLKDTKQYYEIVIQLLEALYIEKIADITRNTEDNLRSLSQSISEKTKPQINAEKLFRDLIQQKVRTNTNNTAYFITNTDAKQPSIHVFHLKHALDLHTERQLKATISTVVTFILPRSLHPAQLEVITYLLEMLTEDEKAAFLIESEDKEEITALFTHYLQTFLQQKNDFGHYLI
ncbi:PRD domain-containing protein [Listeria sp. PSOL-1]|uniref:BglG family transcription antiterminator n=1 Tax=Listeria sp. PSOL-1 TaxID=1844999 RepID=UPI0013D688F8|nr:PRD domain-containing protein [Listeria sp. PSOL-1]